ncbi:hypothetical protein Lfu02_06250 [Longispora fulva]|uniref:DUF2785 domain-containing protein n=1 Tax=Longispora fulva TaxID=619741 RepID=A0A8J7KNR6_9ACTN|nr:DUF2785 domain-containing protein [Longispora fulva]MBG6135507.1 hypothetical protein [Longispora fulva]GIG56253.1 hypothetical protein Lfu02_06250 [Longispora fulva]
MTDWNKIVESDYAVPGDRDLTALTAELSAALADPDPLIRDGAPYRVLGTWIRRGVLDAELPALGDAMAARFDHPEVQARTFAPLVLAWIVDRRGAAPAWVTAFERWYPAEEDLRGHDPDLGWLHAVAHGADLLGVYGRTEPTRMLDVAARRLIAPAALVWRDQEDDRLAHAVAVTLTHPELTADGAGAWLEPVAADFRAGKPGPPPAHASNAMRTLRALYVLVDRGVRAERNGAPVRVAHREAVLEALAATLAVVAPFAG